MRFQKLMWCNMMKSTKSKKASILHYSIDIYIYMQTDIWGRQLGIDTITKKQHGEERGGEKSCSS